MGEDLLEIHSHGGEGYKPLVDYGSWRVAILRFADGSRPGHQASMERHLETDEVFVLVEGQGTLILGGHEAEVGLLSAHEMEIGKVYNVKRAAWHTVSLSRDALIVIVENRDTRQENSAYEELSDLQRQWIAGAIHGQGAGNQT
jgi:hypothetical protein